MLSLSKIKGALSRFFDRGEPYLLVEILNHYVQVTFFHCHQKKKEITVVKNWIREVPDFTIANVIEEAKLLLRKIRKLEQYKIIVSLDSGLATSIYSSVSLIRTHPKEVIDEADMDNLISQAIWRFFDRNRFRVAQKMGIDEVDVLLSDVRIRGIKLDGHKIINPVGFKSKFVEIFFSQTFTPRDFMRQLRDSLPKESVVLIAETGSIIGNVISKSLDKDDFFIANLFPDQSVIFSSSAERLGHLDSFGWGEKNLHASLSQQYKLDLITTRAVVDRYIAGDASPVFLRRFEAMVADELGVFAKGLESVTDSENSPLYINSFFSIPPIIFSDRFQSYFNRRLQLVPLSTQFITEKFGFAVQFKKSVQIKN